MGLEIGASSLKLVELTGSPPVLKTYARRPTPPGVLVGGQVVEPAALAQEIRELLYPVINAMVEALHVPLLQGEVELIDTPSASGRGQKIARCPRCKVAVWSHYPQAGPAVCFVRVGTLDEPDACPPDVHIYTDSKQSWLTLPAGVRSFAGFYDLPAVWPHDSLKRMARLRAAAKS